jgi:hypothetical protein
VKLPDNVVAKLNAADCGVEKYDRLGLPIPLGEWVERIEDPEYCIVQQTTVGDVLISTVWVGLDCAWGKRPPIIFETMLITGDNFELHGRYSTEEEARAGHEAACRMVRGK